MADGETVRAIEPAVCQIWRCPVCPYEAHAVSVWALQAEAAEHAAFAHPLRLTHG